MEYECCHQPMRWMGGTDVETGEKMQRWVCGGCGTATEWQEQPA